MCIYHSAIYLWTTLGPCYMLIMLWGWTTSAQRSIIGPCSAWAFHIYHRLFWLMEWFLFNCFGWSCCFYSCCFRYTGEASKLFLIKHKWKGNEIVQRKCITHEIKMNWELWENLGQYTILMEVCCKSLICDSFIKSSLMSFWKVTFLL